MQEYKEQYYNGRDRMNPYLENKIKSNTTDISKNPAFPSVDRNGNPINFVELLAYKRFLDVVKRVKHYTGMHDVSGENAFMQLQSKLQKSIFTIFQIEKQHRNYLERLGVDLVTQEMELPKDAIKINAKIVDMGDVENDGFSTQSKEPKKDEVEIEFKEIAQENEMTPMQVFELEKDKRRFINLLIQGASKKGHYMFELRRTELNKLHPELANLYGIVMSINDLTYWLMPENIIEQMTNNPKAVAGKEQIEESEDETKIKTQAICFPVSVHENIKGVMEVFGTHGLPDSKEAQEMIFNSTDTLMNEVWDIRLGVVVWEKFINAYPIQVFEEGNRFVQHYIFTKFCSLDADEFFKVAKQILTDNPNGIKYIQELVDDIYADVKKRDLDDTFGDYEFADGGRVKTIKESDINVGSKFVLVNGEVIEIIRLFKQNGDEDWVEYTRNGEVNENKVNSLKNFINNWRADKKESGGMAGLSDVSAMLPNPLPMSTIQPMADGGEIPTFVVEVNEISNWQNNWIEHYAQNIDDARKMRDKAQERLGSHYAVGIRKIKAGEYADGGQPVQYVPVQQMPQQPVQYVPVQSVPQQMPQQPANSPMGNLDINSAIEFVKQNPQVLAMLEDGGSVQKEVDYIDRRIHNLEELVVVMNDDEKDEMYSTINNLKKERENLLKKGSSVEVEEKKHFWQFEKGGKIKPSNKYDVYDNKRMLQNQANEVEHHSKELNSQVKKTKQVPAWVISKMERATTDLSDITHYLDGENKMANGGKVGEVKYDIVPHRDKFIVVKITYKQHEDYTYPSKDFIYGFNGKFLEFNDMKSAQNFIDNIEPKYPYGIPKANAGMIMLASQLLQQQQQQQQQPQAQPQAVYYVPQPVPQPVAETQEHAGIEQDIPEMADGGELDDALINDFCITNLIELANEIQPVKYFVTDRFKESDLESKNYKGRLIIVFKEPASINVVESITKFIEMAEDCHHLLEQSVNVSGSEPTGLSINLLSDKYSDREFNKGGKVYDYAPKKINIGKTKKIRTNLGDYNVGLITNDFVYFVNSNEGDDNANTIMYNKKGELLSDNYFANADLHETLIEQSEFEFIHPDIEAYRQELLKEN